MIGFCFLTYDDIERTDVWEKFFENIDKSKYELFVNSKNSNLISQNQLFKHKMINNPYKNTERGTFSLLVAQDRLLKEAFNNTKIQHFIILSHNTIPVKSFENLQHFLSNKQSVFNYEISIDEEHITRYETIKNPKFKKSEFFVHDHWCILSRKDVSILLNDFEKIKNIFGKMSVPEEHACVNYLIHYKNVSDIYYSKLTHIIWEKKIFWEKNNKYCWEEYNPKIFEKIELKDIPNDCYFLRKVDKNTEIKILF